MHVQIRGLQDNDEINVFIANQSARFKTDSLAIAEVCELFRHQNRKTV